MRETTRPSAGRPPIGGQAGVKGVRVETRLGADDLKWLESAAKAENLKRADYLRRIIREARARAAVR